MGSREDYGKLLLRLAVGGLMLFHGVSKLQHGVGFIVQMLQGAGWPGFLAYGVYVGEVVAPIMILAGVGTRIAGLIVAFDMVVAIGLVHSKHIFALSEMGGAWAIELEMFYLLTGLSLAFLGGGRLGFSKGGGKWD